MTVADLTPNALAQLEAKLVAELDMVRKVRALLEEHQRGQGTAAAPVEKAALPPVAMATVPAKASGSPVPNLIRVGDSYSPPKPTKSYEQWILDGVRLMPPEGFVLGQLKSQLYKDKQDYRDDGAKQEISRLMRTGRVVVVKTATGRIGNTYRYVPTAEELAAKAAAEAANASGDGAKGKPAAETAES